LTHQLPRSGFEPIFGIVLLAAGIWLAWQPASRVLLARPRVAGDASDNGQPFNTMVGGVGSAYIGLISTLLGIGGGVIQVPFLVKVLRFPPHVATATSQLVLAVLALVATVSHLYLGAFQTGVEFTMYLAVGVMMGAPVGALISTRVQGSLLVRMLALALCAVGVRLIGVF
jgi:uncharacterized membrane protein YfcA